MILGMCADAGKIADQGMFWEARPSFASDLFDFVQSSGGSAGIVAVFLIFGRWSEKDRTINSRRHQNSLAHAAGHLKNRPFEGACITLVNNPVLPFPGMIWILRSLT